MKRRHVPTKNRRPTTHRGPLPVGAAVMAALALMAAWQLRLAADEPTSPATTATPPAPSVVTPAAPTAVPSPAAAAAPASTDAPAPPAEKAPAARPDADAAHATDAARSSDAASAAADRRRLREGAQLTNSLGHFRQTGDVIAFIDEEGRDIGGLPNLNLERVIRMLKTVDEPESIWWSISGTVTEFAGRNYVLISRAVYKAATPPPSPERVGE